MKDQSVHQVSVGDWEHLTECLVRLERAILDLSLQDQSLVKPPFSQVKLATLQLKQIALSYGLTTKSKAVKSCCESTKQHLGLHLKNCSTISKETRSGTTN